MSDTGKQSALRQTPDGSFELVVGDAAGLEEISDHAPGYDTSTHERPRLPQPEPTTERKRPVALLAVGAVALVALVVGGIVFARSDTEPVATEGDAPALGSFTPYAGGAEVSRSARRAPTRRVERPVAAQPDAGGAVAEVSESEEPPPGWEVTEEAEGNTEPEVIILEDGSDDVDMLEAAAGVGVDEPEEESADEVEAETGSDDKPKLRPPKIDSLRRPVPSALGRTQFAPRSPVVPNFQPSGLITSGRVKLPSGSVGSLDSDSAVGAEEVEEVDDTEE